MITGTWIANSVDGCAKPYCDNFPNGSPICSLTGAFLETQNTTVLEVARIRMVFSVHAHPVVTIVVMRQLSCYCCDHDRRYPSLSDTVSPFWFVEPVPLTGRSMTEKDATRNSGMQFESDVVPVPVDPTYRQADSVTEVPVPVKPSERIQAIDVLRGVAVLGILVMNVVFFGWPMPGYENPTFSGGNDVVNTSAWVINTMFFSAK